MRVIIVGVSFLFLQLTGALKVLAEEPNLVPNPGFEQGGDPPTGWLFRSPDDSDPAPYLRLSVSSGEARSGNRSVKAENNIPPGDPPAEWLESELYTQRLPVTAGKRYRFGYYTKTQNATRIRSHVFWQKQNGEYLGGSGDVLIEFSGAPINHDWQLQETEIEIPETAGSPPEPVSTVTIFLYNQGHGNCWFDDVFLTPKAAPLDPLFPDLAPDSFLDHQDQLLMTTHFNPQGMQMNEIGLDEVLEMVAESRNQEEFQRGVLFREYFPLKDGSRYVYRASNIGDDKDYFDMAVDQVPGENAFKVSITDSNNPDAKQGSVFTGEGPVAITAVNIDEEFDAGVLKIPVQTVTADTPLIIGVQRLDLGFDQTTQGQGNLRVILPSAPLPLTVPVRVTLRSRVISIGERINIGDDLGTEVSKTITVEYVITFQDRSPVPVLPGPVVYTPGSGRFTFMRGVGLIQLQQFVDPHTLGQKYPLRSAQIGGRIFP